MGRQTESLVCETEAPKKKFTEIQTEFLHVFDKEKAPSKQIMYAWMAKFDAYWSLENLNKKTDTRDSHSGRKRVRDEATIARVRQDVENSPKRSRGGRSQALNLSLTDDRRRRLAMAGAFLRRLR